MKNNILRNSGIDIRFGGLPSPAKKECWRNYKVQYRNQTSQIINGISILGQVKVVSDSNFDPVP